ncbi:hypothetical protein D0T84_00520 [Dysgonomonas sp. 521]|uniref:reverse transcriptase/maturase family protein n=1 Tax=Dysgonomonas sp. 521 TaxID=2302932 RepID=UPI0013D59C47|nr:reverse transcriptase/maturase family protein [Dysgonomonas sp. 521]NDV93402.1 hypothetical protein [Dysgonomonas sp. 521]
MKDDNLLTDLFMAYFDARKNKRNTINQVRFEIDYEKNVLALYRDITGRTYKVSPGICFIIDEPVKREIFAADFRDRVIHHLLFNYINPVFDKVFIDDSYSCRKGKGTLYGIRRIESFIRECSGNYMRDCYILKLDIRGYFMNIDKNILHMQLFSMLHKAGENGDTPFGADQELIMYLIKAILDDNPVDNCRIKGRKSDWNGLPPSKSLFNSLAGSGLPIGNLTSQLFSNVYLHPLDCFVKETLGFRYYGRYVDDLAIIHTDKELLKQAIIQIRDFLSENLNLELHPHKIYLQHYTKGVNFLGATLKPHRSYIANRTKKKFRQCVNDWNRRLSSRNEPDRCELEKMRASVNSYLGIMVHHRTYNIRKKMLLEKENHFFRYGYLSGGLRHFVLKKMTITGINV